MLPILKLINKWKAHHVLQNPRKICYDLDVPMEDIPEEFVPLKNFFHSLVDMAIEKRHRIVILLGGAS